MAKLANFVFPPRRSSTPPAADTEVDIETQPQLPRERPQISLQTRTHSREREGPAYRLSVPEVTTSLAKTLNPACSTPPDSPRTHAYKLGSSTNNNFHGNSGIDPHTPPLTPTRSKHTPSNSKGSITSLDGTLQVPPSSSLPMTNAEKVGSDELIIFPYQATDYKITTTDAKGTKKVLGSGLWSDVYHATPTLPLPLPTPSNASPPITPHSRSSSLTSASLPSLPPAYAIKTPSSAAAAKVLREEARILSYLTRFPGSENYIVPFYGHDPRSGALVLKLMDSTLEDWITHTLNTLPEPARAAKLNRVFPGIARQLLDALVWMKEKGVVHADIKPANILVSTRTSTSDKIPQLQVLLTDFSSAILSPPSPTRTTTGPSSTTPSTTLGGGTWDFLAPHFLHAATRNAVPTPTTDLWAAAITLLVLAIGESPYACLGGNVFRRRECVGKGDPVGFVGYGERAVRNVARLKGLGGGGMVGIFRRVLGEEKVVVGGERMRVGVEEWRERVGREFEGSGVGGEGGARI
ncbi:kinase-like protein [Byssothecium circinans]|uniref:Kinase-like protein n=1 Tax=Byssothecium circinans TaxID=147558 RepID=A0A6A5TL92_9PLEO|nr:kinase-like protein [Byssothecium circinans]